jgi:hypothetical protein
VRIYGFVARNGSRCAKRRAFSHFYRSALRAGNQGCFGFLIGMQREFTRPVFDMACVVKETKFGEPFNIEPARLERNFASCKQLAAKADAKMIGLFIAWDALSGNCRHELFGILTDTAIRLDLPFVAEFPTDGHETFWGIRIFFANRFPHEQLPYKMLPRRSRRAEHNPRRILRLWKSMIV